MSRSEEVLAFWFGPPIDDAEAMGKRMRFWFRGGAEVDQEIRERFGADFERAKRGELADWAETPRGRLALIIMLDQFSRNLYRGTAEAFAQDGAAQKLTVEGLDVGMDATLSPHERMFFALPLGHAEDLALQQRALAYVDTWVGSLPAFQQGLAQGARGEVIRHHDVIARFGRFPTRNLVLGRESTAEEIAYLEQVKATGQPV